MKKKQMKKMSDARYWYVDKCFNAKNSKNVLTKAERKQGWHFCSSWDFMLIGPEDPALKACTCFPRTHRVYKTIPIEGEVIPLHLAPMVLRISGHSL